MADAAEEIAKLIAAEMQMIRDVDVRESLTARLQPPTVHLRNWDYGAKDERYPCWTVISDDASDSAIVYSSHGFGPANPWGLVSLSSPWFGMDSGWFVRLEEAFVDSCMASDLPIWDVVVRGAGGRHQTMARSLRMNAAFQLRDELARQDDKTKYEVMYRSERKDGVS